MEAISRYLTTLRWQDILDIIVVSYIIYRIILLVKGTRAVQMASGLAVLILIYFVARELELLTLHWLLGTILSSLFILIIIIFQDDIRRVLMQMGQTPFTKTKAKTFQAIEEIAKAAAIFSEDKIGSLVIIEREVGLGDYVATGIKLNAEVTRYLLATIFYKGTSLHDGAVIIQNGRISSAASMLPLTTNPDVSRRLGTRHRAAIGITEQTDAVAIIVSEETGNISVAIGGKITRDIDINTLRRILYNAFSYNEKDNAWWKRKFI